MNDNDSYPKCEYISFETNQFANKISFCWWKNSQNRQAVCFSRHLLPDSPVQHLRPWMGLCWRRASSLNF